MSKLFTAEGAWLGSVYGLEIEFGLRSDRRLAQAYTALWSFPALAHPVAAREPEPEEQEVVSPETFVALGSAFGAGTLPDGLRVPCAVHAYRPSPSSTSSRDEQGTDWLWFRVPLGSLRRVWPEVGSFPFVGRDEPELAHAAWQQRIEAWLLELARSVYASVPFRLAVIGHQLEGDNSRRWWRWQREGFPSERWESFLVPGDDGELAWHPQTRRGGWVLCDPDLTWADIFNQDSETAD